MKHLWRAICAGFALLLALNISLSASAQERITRYDVTIDVQKNADLIVTEEIAVISEGRAIRRGIFRDLPRFKLDEGDTIPYQYKILSVIRNGEREPYDKLSKGNAKRVRIGDADVMLTRGEHVYEVRYRVKNEIRYHDEMDELYWNVTGNYWKFPIEYARVSVNFPDGTRASSMSEIHSYTGQEGDDISPYETLSYFDPIIVETQKTMQGGQGLTISVMFEKGVVNPPSTADKGMLWWFKNGALFLLSFSLVGLFGYYYLTWDKIGRDPPKLPVFPRYEPPKGYSAAAVHRIVKHGASEEALSATLMALAVKGAMHIESQKKKTVLKYLGTDKLSAPLLDDEAYLLDKLFKGRPHSMTLTGEYNANFTRAHKAFMARLDKLYSDKYFKFNAGKTALGVILSGLAIFAAMSQVYGSWKPGFAIVFAALVLLNIVFAFLLPAPTKRGQKVSSEIDGFKLYLKTAESKRFAKQVSENVADAPPTMTQELYERYLPYAVALDVEKPWSKYFAKMLPETAEKFAPAWGGVHNSRGGASGFSRALSSNLSSGVSSSLPQSSSSSGGGGGGSSGGGGGGGGGGGW